jgi:hypothetical protein
VSYIKIHTSVNIHILAITAAHLAHLILKLTDIKNDE